MNHVIIKQFAILDHMPVGAFVLQEDFVVIFWNSCLEDWTGIPRSKIIGKNIGAYFPHLKTPKYSIRIQNVFKTGMPFIFSSYIHQYIIPVTLPNKQTQIQSTIVTRVPDLNEAAFYALFSIQDVTELTHRIRDYRIMRDQAQKEVKERKQAEERLKESEDRLRRVVENMPVLMVAFDEHKNLIVWNGECERVTGYSAAEIIGNPRALEFLYPDPNYREWAVTELAQQNNEFYNLELEFTSKDGTPKIVAWSNTSRQFPIPGWTMWATGVDVTERKQAEEAIQNAKKAAEEANRAKSNFLANMSHELRTPLNAILGFTQLIGHSPNLEPEQRKNLSIISRSGEHLLTLINQVLDLSKIEAGKMTLNPTGCDFYRLLDDVVDLFRLRTKEKGLQLLFDRASNVPQYVRIDEVKLRQVLINLLSNAIKFTEEGCVTLRVSSQQSAVGREQRVSFEEKVNTANCQLPTANLLFEVQDTGLGIAPEELDRLFEAFVQTTTGKETQEGTGLGLPISQKFVQLMGGDIQVKSEVGRGTTFTFDIQCKIGDPNAYYQSSIVNRVIALEPDQPQYRILIADDKRDSRQLLVELLKPLGFELQEATSGQEALDVWKEWEPHLIWMDNRMPGMNGHEVAKQIKATSKGQSTVIIAITTSSFEEEQATLLSVGCDDFLRKPFKEAEILDLMHKHLGVRYIYDKDTQQPVLPAEIDINALTPAVFADLPPDLLANLEHATITSDITMISSLIDQIHSHNAALAEMLTHLINNFEYMKILTCLQELKK